MDTRTFYEKMKEEEKNIFISSGMENLNNLFSRYENEKGLTYDNELRGNVENFNSSDLNISCYFEDIESKLIEKILEFKDGVIFGCVAWLTNERILKALAEVRIVQIVVQKEDFLRPDINEGKWHKEHYTYNYDNDSVNKSFWAKKIRELYSNITFDVDGFNSRHGMRYGVSYYSICSNMFDSDSIRCMGNLNSDKNPVHPRCHHKFLVFCDIEEYSEKEKYDHCCEFHYEAKAVWTGSFNFSKTASYSLENAMYLECKGNKINPIIEQYLKEHHDIFTVSEPLNWEDEWVSPEYRIGT